MDDNGGVVLIGGGGDGANGRESRVILAVPEQGEENGAADNHALSIPAGDVSAERGAADIGRGAADGSPAGVIVESFEARVLLMLETLAQKSDDLERRVSAAGA